MVGAQIAACGRFGEVGIVKWPHPQQPVACGRFTDEIAHRLGDAGRGDLGEEAQERLGRFAMRQRTIDASGGNAVARRQRSALGIREGAQARIEVRGEWPGRHDG